MNYTLEEKYRLIKEGLLKAQGKNPVSIAKSIMRLPFVSIHGPEHHFIDGGSLLAAIHNAGVAFDLSEALDELSERSVRMPGAMCGYWGVCGSVSSSGAAMAILHEVGPLSGSKYYKDDMKYASTVLSRMSEIGGPRCCKRNAFLSLSIASRFVKDEYGIELETEPIACEFSARNLQCLKERCPFYKK